MRLPTFRTGDELGPLPARGVAVLIACAGLLLAECRSASFDNPFDPEEAAGLLLGVGGPPLPTLVFSSRPTQLTEGAGATVSFQLQAAEESRDLTVQAVTSDSSVVTVNGSASASVTFLAGTNMQQSLTLNGVPDQPEFSTQSETDNTATVTLSASGYANSLLPLTVLDFANIYPSSSSYNANSKPETILPGDFDGDGKQDLAVIYEQAFNQYRMAYMRNTSTGSGSFAFVVSDSGANVTTSSDYVAAVGDLNFDSKPDLIVSNGTSVTIYRNTSTTGSLAFTAETPLTSSATIRGAAVADLDGDGKNELLLSSSTSTRVLLNNTATAGGAVTFTTSINSSYSAGAGTTKGGIAVQDFNADGKLDLFVGHSTNSASVYRNDSSGAGNISFTFQLNLNTQGSTSVVAAGDLDGDGKPDLVAASTVGTKVIVLARNTTANGSATFSFASGVTITPDNSPRHLELADVNGSGKNDLVVTDYFCHCVSIFQNASSSGSISLVARVDKKESGSTGWSWPKRAAVVDLDGDGRLDLAGPRYFGDSVSVFRNRRP